MKKYFITSFLNANGESCSIFEDENMTTYFLRYPESRIDAAFKNTNYSVLVNYIHSLGYTEEA